MKEISWREIWKGRIAKREQVNGGAVVGGAAGIDPDLHRDDKSASIDSRVRGNDKGDPDIHRDDKGSRDDKGNGIDKGDPDIHRDDKNISGNDKEVRGNDIGRKLRFKINDFRWRAGREVWARRFAIITAAIFGITLIGSLVAGVVFVVLARELPSPNKIVRKEGFSTKIFDRNGKLLYDVFSDKRRTPVKIYEVPKYLKDATVAIEDQEFYLHPGFDIRGYLRIPYYFITQRRLVGGSTLTQQLVKNVLLTNERSVIRKIKEFVLTLEIEGKYSKDQILQMYLNEAPYGGTAWGVEEAAQSYFGVSVSELNLTQSAFLAGLPQSPSYYSPFNNESKAYIDRTKAVLRRMREDGYISAEDETKSLDELIKLTFYEKINAFKAPHFVMYVKKLLEDKYGDKVVELGGLRVTTSLDLDLQEKAQKIVTDEIAKVESMHITNGAAVIADPTTGEILAMIGSKNYDDPNYDGKVNVTLAKRQPGSTIKPVTYVTALKKGLTASTMIADVITRFPQGERKADYVPTNYDGKEHGPVQLRFALGNSFNIPAVKLLAWVGIKDMLTTAFDMGFSTLEPTSENLSRFGLAVTLGGGEVKLLDMTEAYSAFANGGFKVEPVAILKITDMNGNVLEETKPIAGKQILSQGEAFIISNILADNGARKVTFGESNQLKFADRQVAVKTGTTNDKRDNWTIGWTPQGIIGVWVGNNDNSQILKLASGISGAAPIWRKLTLLFHEGKEKVDFSVPDDVTQVMVDSMSGYKEHDGYSARGEYFIKGTEPKDFDPVHQKLKLCKSQGKLATNVDIVRGNYEEKEFFNIKEADPQGLSKDGIDFWQKGINEWITKQNDSRYNPPVEYCNTTNDVDVSISEPGHQSQVGNDFTVKVRVTTENDVSRVEVFVDGQSKSLISETPFELQLRLTDGPHTIKAEATDINGNKGSAENKIGVNVSWDWAPSPTPAPTNTPSPTLVPTVIPTVTAVPIVQ